MKRKLVIALLFLGFVFNLEAQSVLDGVYTKSKNNESRDFIPYVQLREADIMWAKRVWRIVDMKEKMNQVFYYPINPDQGRKNFMTVILEGIQETGNITAYDPNNDMFEEPMTVEQLYKEHMSRTQVIQVWDEETMSMKQEEVQDTISARDITRFKIKEEVFFDKQRSVLETRILGICPLVEVYKEGEFLGYQELFWIYFPEARTVFAKSEVYNRQNDVHRLTYDDIFWKRMFSSTITKETNVYNRSLQQYLSPLDAVLEAERIEEQIFNFEHDLWSF